MAQKAHWEFKQREDLAGVMKLRREEIKEVKQAVDGIAVEMAGIRSNHPVSVPAAPVRPRGVTAVAPAALPGPGAIERAAPAPMVATTPEPEGMVGVVGPSLQRVTGVEGPAEDPVGGGVEGKREVQEPVEGRRPPGRWTMQPGSIGLPLYYTCGKASAECGICGE